MTSVDATIPKSGEITFDLGGCSSEQSAAFCEGVIATLEKLGVEFDYDEWSPENRYTVAGLRPSPSESTAVLLAHYAVLISRDGVESSAAKALLEEHQADAEFVRLAGTSRRVKEALTGR